MRKLGPPSEVVRLAAPVSRVIDGAWRRMHWWIGTMAVLYLLSGITIVRPDEAAVVLRWGRLVGATPALQEHGPGLLFAFPRPVDRIIRVQVKHVWEVPVRSLASIYEVLSESLDPLTQGYALTGDQNIVHAGHGGPLSGAQPGGVGSLWSEVRGHTAGGSDGGDDSFAR